MLGKHHISLSLLTVFPFLIPLIFYPGTDLILVMVFALFVFIGALAPDADCGGKASLFYKFPWVDKIMKVVIMKPIVFVFKHLIKNKYELEYEVSEEHRGIMHSPIGILLSSFMLSMIILIFMLITQHVSWWVLLFLSISFFIGQLLHLIEDSCTVSGINWKFPFKTKELKGKIYTFQKGEKRDIRPSLFVGILGFLSIAILIYSVLAGFNSPIYLVELMILPGVILIWIIIIAIAKTDWPFWYWEIEKIKKIKQRLKNIAK